jgi:hypothetical protein
MTDNHHLLPKLREFISNEITGKQYHDKAGDISAVICMMMDQLILIEDEECDKITDWGVNINESRCTVIQGGHRWVYDQCGYWAHKYCAKCHLSKYPELALLSCSDIIANVGNISESDYLSKRENGTK